MPAIRPYVSTEASRGRALNNTRAQPDSVDVSGLAKAGAQIAGGMVELQDAQDRARKQLELDEARMSVANTMSEATVLWTERMTDAQSKAPKGATGFTDTTLKDFDAWAKERTAGAIHPQGRKVLEDSLRRMRQGIHAEAFKFEIGQRNKALVTDYEEGLDADRRAVMAQPDLFAETAARRVATAQALSLPAETREKMAVVARESLAFDAANALVDKDAAGFLERAGVRSAKGRKGKQGGQAEDAADRIASDPLLSSMPPEKLRAVIDRASTVVAQQEAALEAERARRVADSEAAANRRERHANQAFTILSGFIGDGRKLDESLPSVQTALKAIEGTPYAQAYRDMLNSAPGQSAAAVQPIARQEAELQALYARRNTQGTGKEVEAEIKRREQVLNAAKTDYGREPLVAASERGVPGFEAGLAPVDLTNLDSITSTIAARVAQADIAGEKAGRAVAPLTNAEVQGLMQRVAAQPVQQRAQTVATLAASMPPHQAEALAKQLDGQSKSDQSRAFAAMFHAGADKTTAGRYTAEIIAKGAEALQTRTIKEEKTPVDGWRARINKITSEAYRNPQEAEFIAEKARFVLAGLVAEGGASNEAAVSRAVALAAGGSIRDHNGARIPMPAGVDPSDFRDRLRSVTPEKLSLPDGKVYVNTGSAVLAIPADEFLQSLPEQKLTYVRRGRYAVQVGTTYAARADGTPIVIEP